MCSWLCICRNALQLYSYTLVSKTVKSEWHHHKPHYILRLVKGLATSQLGAFYGNTPQSCTVYLAITMKQLWMKGFLNTTLTPTVCLTTTSISCRSTVSNPLPPAFIPLHILHLLLHAKVLWQWARDNTSVGSNVQHFDLDWLLSHMLNTQALANFCQV